MQANLETLGTLERKLSVALPAAEIDSEVENRLKRLSRTVKMHGFRPGKVPFKVVVQQYGPQVRQEVLGDAMQKSFGEAVRQQNLKVAGYPRFELNPPADGAGQFRYSATFEIYPEVVVGDINYTRRYFEQLFALTPADLKRVLRTYLVPERLTVVSSNPKADAAKLAPVVAADVVPSNEAAEFLAGKPG